MLCLPASSTKPLPRSYHRNDANALFCVTSSKYLAPVLSRGGCQSRLMLIMKKLGMNSRLLRTSMMVLGLLAVGAFDADARRSRDLARGAAIGAGIGVLLDGGRGVMSGATAGLLVAAISRRGR